MKIIPYGRQCIDNSDIAEVVKVLRSDWITQGPKVKEFEEALAKYCKAKYAVAVSSGTAALHLACLAAGLEKGDEAITTPITFLATANSIIYAGAKPVFADIDYETVNISPGEIKKKITKKTKAILPVHFAGLPCDMPEIAKIAKRHKLNVIEDACHALGAEYKSNNRWVKVGSCLHSDMTVFSFHPVKNITTGEGGAVTTNNRRFYEKLIILRNHGMYKSISSTKKQPWLYKMIDLGFNYRITDFQSALGLSQLKKIDRFLIKRRSIAGKYIHSFADIKAIETQKTDKNKIHAYHLFIIKLNLKNAKTAREEFYNQLHRMNIGTQIHYIPVHLQPYYRRLFGYRSGDFPKAEDYYNRCISIPLFPDMKDEEIHFVIDSIKTILG
jgi:UDP-4-amino-4,6-dideoxy-N-acetyl-beta-L-altrosamine transaminase